MNPVFISLASEVRSATMELLLITRDKIGRKVVVRDAQTQDRRSGILLSLLSLNEELQEECSSKELRFLYRILYFKEIQLKAGRHRR
jgi:hypothetical protein